MKIQIHKISGNIGGWFGIDLYSGKSMQVVAGSREELVGCMIFSALEAQPGKHVYVEPIVDGEEIKA